jgi:cadmium resistance protein CadD (predicted permease)
VDHAGRSRGCGRRLRLLDLPTLSTVKITLIGQAVGLFALTNVDDIVILALFFGQTQGRSAALRVVSGQYLGFIAILAASIVGALGAQLLPEAAIPYLGLLPLALGLRAAWRAWQEHRPRTEAPDRGDETQASPAQGPGVFAVATVTFANGGDNIGVYVPVFATAGIGGLLTYVLVFLALVGVWCAAGRFFATRPLVARGLSRWGHVLLPIVLIVIGLVILIEGHAFGF